jgi:hypothetical protein
MSAITTLRGTLASALTSASVWSVYSFPPATPIANSCVISPDDPYIVPSNDGYITVAPLVNFKITLIKPLFDNQGNLNGMEDYILELFSKLSASTVKYTIGEVSSPAVMNASSGDFLACDVRVSILSSWS